MRKAPFPGPPPRSPWAWCLVAGLGMGFALGVSGTEAAEGGSHPTTLGSASGVSAVKKDLQQSQKGLRDIQERLRREKQARSAAERREKNLLKRLEGTDKKLERLTREKNANENDLATTRQRVQSLEGLRVGTERDLSAERSSLARRLRALQRDRVSSPLWALALGLQSAGAESRRARFAGQLARSNERLLERVEGRREELIHTSNRLVQEQGRKQRILAALTRQTRRASSERKQRERILASIRTEKTVRDSAIEELNGAANHLRSKVDELLAQAAEVERRERVERVPARPEGRPTGSVAPPVAPLRGGPGLQRNLPWPVRGEVIQNFGKTRRREFNATVASSGLQIQAAKGTPIRAVAAGRVRYADWFEGYGKLVILDHGQGYYSLYAQAAEVQVAPGDQVAAGQTIATVGDTGSLVGDSLYFEIRKNGLPQDPRIWLRKG